jgi:hypothetical protein
VASGFGELTQQAHALVAAGDLAGARDLLGAALRGADPSPGNAEPDLAEAAGLQARVLVTLGDAHAARGWAAFAYSAATRLYGPTDQRTVAAAATLAAVLHRVGNHARAAELYRDVIIELTATDGPESLRVLAAHADLATVEYAQGECTVARDRLQDAWELHREVYGDAHPSGIRMLARLGAMQRDCGRFAEAHQSLALARELCRAHLPADHPLTAQVAALARAAADPDHVCADASTPTGKPPRAPAARIDTPADPPDPGPGAPPGTTHAYGVPEPASESVPPAPASPHSASVPPPRLPLAPPVSPPPVGPAPRWATPAGERSARPPVPPPRSAVDHVGSPVPEVHDPDGADDEDPDVEPGWWPPTVAPPDPVAGAGSGRPEPATPALPPAVPAFIADGHPGRTRPAPGPRRTDAEEFDETDSGRFRHLPAIRSPRLPVRIPRPDRPGRRMSPAVVAGLVLLVLTGTAAVATGFGLTGNGEERPVGAARTTGAASPAASPPASPGAPPGEVTLVDDRTRVTLTWAYPVGAAGRVVLAGGRAGQELRPFQELPPGSTGYVVYNLDARTNYCFSVAVVYSPEVVGRADPVCTERSGSEPAR